MSARIRFWWKSLRLGATRINSAAGWLATVALVLGFAGIVVPLVFHLSGALIAVVLLGLLVLVIAEGAYREWHDTDEQRKIAAGSLEAAADQGASRRMAQARLVEVLRTSGKKPLDFGGAYGVTIRVRNGSGQAIRNVVFSWKKGNDFWGEPKRVDYLAGGQETSEFREFPGDQLSDADEKSFSAFVYFQDAGKVWWCAKPDGTFEETSNPLG